MFELNWINQKYHYLLSHTRFLYIQPRILKTKQKQASSNCGPVLSETPRCLGNSPKQRLLKDDTSLTHCWPRLKISGEKSDFPRLRAFEDKSPSGCGFWCLISTCFLSSCLWWSSRGKHLPRGVWLTGWKSAGEGLMSLTGAGLNCSRLTVVCDTQCKIQIWPLT